MYVQSVAIEIFVPSRELRWSCWKKYQIWFCFSLPLARWVFYPTDNTYLLKNDLNCIFGTNFWPPLWWSIAKYWLMNQNCLMIFWSKSRCRRKFVRYQYTYTYMRFFWTFFSGKIAPPLELPPANMLLGRQYCWQSPWWNSSFISLDEMILFQYKVDAIVLYKYFYYKWHSSFAISSLYCIKGTYSGQIEPLLRRGYYIKWFYHFKIYSLIIFQPREETTSTFKISPLIFMLQPKIYGIRVTNIDDKKIMRGTEYWKSLTE